MEENIPYQPLNFTGARYTQACVCICMCMHKRTHTHTHRKSTKLIESSVFIFPMERILKDKAIIRTMDLSQQGADSDQLRL